MTRPATDALSLTLPARSRSRARRKRPRKPTGWEVYYLAFTVWSVAFAVGGFLGGQVLIGGWQAFGAAIYWRLFQRERAGIRPNMIGPLGVVWLAALVPVLIVGG